MDGYIGIVIDRHIHIYMDKQIYRLIYRYIDNYMDIYIKDI